MRASSIWLLLGVALPILSASAWAQTEEKEFYRQQFSDWAGIAFRCQPDEENNTTQKQLCANAAAEARLLAANAKIPFQDLSAESAFQAAVEVNLNSRSLLLETTIRATKGAPRAV